MTSPLFLSDTLVKIRNNEMRNIDNTTTTHPNSNVMKSWIRWVASMEI